MGLTGVVGSNGVSPLITPRVSPLLALQAQVDFTGLAPHCRPLPNTWRVPIGALAGVTVWDMARFEPYPLMVPQPLLAMEFLLTAETLQTTALVTLEDGLICPAAGIALLAHQPRIEALLCWGCVGTHTQTGKGLTHHKTAAVRSPRVMTKVSSLKSAQNFHRVLHTFEGKKVLDVQFRNHTVTNVCVSTVLPSRDLDPQ